MLTNIFTPSDCAACQLCCNFHRSSAWETPSLESELIYLLQEEGYPLHKRCNGATTFFLNFTTNSENEVANCPMLDPNSGCTLPRELRPFECRIWPLRIMRDASTLVIGLYKDCPALRGSAANKLIDFATGELLPTMLDYARKHPTCIRDVDAAYSIIWRE